MVSLDLRLEYLRREALLHHDLEVRLVEQVDQRTTYPSISSSTSPRLKRSLPML